MNIFILNKDPVIAAQMQMNCHVVKMLLEGTQILCNCFDQKDVPYKRTHYNHPCCVWTRKSLSNFNWLKNHAIALSDEYTYRYGKIHKCRLVIDSLKTPDITDIDLTSFALVLPDEFKSNDAVKSYLDYYSNVKLKLKRVKWTKRKMPEVYIKYIRN
jgi:hypothetical protein